MSILVVMTIFFAACTTGDPFIAISPHIVPKASENVLLQSGIARELTSTQVISAEEFRTPIPEDSVPVRLLNENLDYDQPEEQIIAYRAREADEDKRIKIMVAQFDSVYSNVIATWEGATLASESRSFSMFTEDVTGDFSKEIISAGIDENGHQTLDIFRQHNQSGSPIDFQPILSLVSPVGLELHRIDRSKDYDNKITAGSSFPVYLYENAESPTLDIIRTQYNWNAVAGRYVPVDVRRVSASEHARKQLGTLFSNETEEIVRNLNGIWIQDDDELEKSMVFIDSTSKYLTLAHAGAQEWFVWKRAYKTVLSLGPGIWIPIQNELLSSISSNKIWIAVLDADTIHVTVDGDKQYYGNYRRLKDIQNTSFTSKKISTASTISFLREQLAGLFTGTDNREFFFSSPNFRFYDGELTHSGIYYIYHAFAPILELTTLDTAQRKLHTQQYQIVFTSQQQDNTKVETIELYPVQVNLTGLDPLAQDPIKVDRILELANL